MENPNAYSLQTNATTRCRNHSVHTQINGLNSWAVVACLWLFDLNGIHSITTDVRLPYEIRAIGLFGGHTGAFGIAYLHLSFIDKYEETPLQKHKINTLHVVPPLMVFLAKHPIVDDYDLSTVKVIQCGAAPLSRELDEAVRQRIGARVVRQGYGLTEATIAVAEQTATHTKSGSVGGLRPGVRGRVRDIESARNLPALQRGELQFASPTLMKGYIDDAAATRETIDADGWLHTGDIGYYDEDGEWFIVDRLKELIKTNGFQVPPAELEGLLLQHPLISDAGVVGVPDERFGEVPLAFVVRQVNGELLSEQEIMEFVAGESCRQ